ncbi:plasmid pRiA4b ORF-3 family protein [Saccharicrinis sp. FJH54]|uniref:plasmid pRiA4b ORF-3 family protein n=1 Tax=Saccharicrinis sp. FJH54 TaxID=3344665 RepID=UPI0035D46D9F
MTYQFKIQLKNISDPTIWRRLTVPSHYTFFEFHIIIQIAFGWFNEHLFKFSPNGYRSYPQIQLHFDDEMSEMEFAHGDVYDAEKIKLSDIFVNEKQKFTYLYDFGDDWNHIITLEKILPETSMYPTLIKGQGMCPPEDCGGPWGYMGLKEILTDPKHPEYTEYRELFLDETDVFNPYEFQIEEHREFLNEVFTNKS